jgi:hypothetical protein
MTPPAATQQGKAYFFGDPSVHIPIEPVDKIAVALDRLLGTTAERLERACEASIFGERAQTRLWIANRRIVRAHREFPSLRADSFVETLDAVAGLKSGRAREAAVTTTDWANVLANALERRLLVSYAEAQYFEQTLIRTGTARSFRAQRVVNIDEMADIPTVAESADYLEAAVPSSTTLSFTPAKKGNLLAFTRETVTNNDVDAVTRHVDNAGRAARRTLAKAAWNLWETNATYGPDSKAWFHADHNNLQTVALSETEVIAAVRKLLDQTRPGSGEKLALRAQPGSLWLTVPNALWDAAYDLNQTDGSALHHLFGETNEFIIVNALLSDANDWGVHLDSAQIESIRVNFLDGREEPELVLADLPNAGALFTHDRVVYKLRHQWGVALAEYRRREGPGRVTASSRHAGSLGDGATAACSRAASWRTRSAVHSSAMARTASSTGSGARRHSTRTLGCGRSSVFWISRRSRSRRRTWSN